MFGSLLCAAIVLASFVAPSVFAAGSSLYVPGGTGIDVSWPSANCSAKPPTDATFGIVGVTGGLDFTHNPCLFSEAHWFNQLSLYMNTGFPSPDAARKLAHSPKHCGHDDNACIAYDYGYNAAQYALLYAASQNIHSTVWWLDVETENSWTATTQVNQASIQGAIDAIKQATILPTIGIYSTPRQWQIITGGWKNDSPNWVGTGSDQRTDAIAACKGNDFTGGGTILTQYILNLDHDYACASETTTQAIGPLLP